MTSLRKASVSIAIIVAGTASAGATPPRQATVGAVEAAKKEGLGVGARRAAPVESGAADVIIRAIG